MYRYVQYIRVVHISISLIYLHHGPELDSVLSTTVLNLDTGISGPEGVVDRLVIGLCIRAPAAARDVKPLPSVGTNLEAEHVLNSLNLIHT